MLLNQRRAAFGGPIGHRPGQPCPSRRRDATGCLRIFAESTRTPRPMSICWLGFRAFADVPHKGTEACCTALWLAFRETGRRRGPITPLTARCAFTSRGRSCSWSHRGFRLRRFRPRSSDGIPTDMFGHRHRWRVMRLGGQCDRTTGSGRPLGLVVHDVRGVGGNRCAGAHVRNLGSTCRHESLRVEATREACSDRAARSAA